MRAFNSTLAKKSLAAILLLTSSTSFAHDAGSSAEAMDNEAAYIEQIRTEQNSFYQQVQEDIMNGVPVDVAGGSCQYIAGIFQAPPPKVVTLTFDDGPSSSLTPVVLGILKKYNIKATFFMLGKEAKKYPGVVQKVIDEGHLVASHSYDHANFHALSEGQQVSEIVTNDGILSPGMPPSLKLFRYPYGNSTCFSNSQVKNLGYAGIVGWHIDSCDWAFAKNGWVTPKQAQTCAVSGSNMASFAGHVRSAVKQRNGGIILMHEIHANTVNSLEEIIVGLKQDGYTFRNLTDPSMRAYLK